MTWVKWAMLLYALAMIGMGVHGTVKAGEWMSLAGGGGIGFVVLIGLWLSLVRSNPRAGYILAVVVSFAAAGMFLPKYLGPNGKLYPHLVIAVLSFANIACLVGGHLAAMAAKNKEAR